MISEFFSDPNDVLLIPRPRRFGKTLNLSMIEHFFDITKKESSNLFSEFKIAENKNFCKQHQNRYPVINLSFKNVKSQTWGDCFENIKVTVSELYEAHNYLLKSEKLESYEKQLFEKIILRTGSLTEYQYSLKNLSKYLQNHFDKKVIILVDEYDTPIIYGYEATYGLNKSDEKYYSNIVDFMRTFLGAAFKENENLEKGLITGIMRIARESIFSELKNLGVFTITSPYFADKFGFTAEETQKLLHYFDLQDSYENVKKWYNGYKFGDVENIYNPWSIVNFIGRKEEGFKPYWINTGSDILIKEQIKEADIREALLKLIEGKTIEKTISETFVFADLGKKDELLWTLLLHSGYLSQVREVFEDVYELRIPNYEIQKVFKNIILDWIETKYQFKKILLLATTKSLINNKIQEFEEGFKKIIGDTFSYFDTATNPEYAYQAYTLGLLAILSDEYIIKSNRESGEGRYDILLLPKDNNANGVVIEIKQIVKQREKENNKSFATRINRAIETAKTQIDKNKYFKELIDAGIATGNIIKVPIVFAGKEPFVLPKK